MFHTRSASKQIAGRSLQKMHGTRARSAVTKGSRLFAEHLDMRTPRGKRFKDLIDCYTHDAGGDRLSAAQRSLVRELAMLQVLSEDLQLEYMLAGSMSNETRVHYTRVSNTIRQHQRALGLIKPMARDESNDDDDVDPLVYAQLAHARSCRRQRLKKRSE
jgi:hypothetical protein